MGTAEAASEPGIMIVVELPDTPEGQWVLDPRQHHFGLRVCNDVTCVTAATWRRLADGEQP
jgi:hypothetical protein